MKKRLDAAEAVAELADLGVQAIVGPLYSDEALAAALNLPVRRWGGNATTRYNWQNDTSNRASDWFFENIPDETALAQLRQGVLVKGEVTRPAQVELLDHPDDVRGQGGAPEGMPKGDAQTMPPDSAMDAQAMLPGTPSADADTTEPDSAAGDAQTPSASECPDQVDADFEGACTGETSCWYPTWFPEDEPCVGEVCFGDIGYQLDCVDGEWHVEDVHHDGAPSDGCDAGGCEEIGVECVRGRVCLRRDDDRYEGEGCEG